MVGETITKFKRILMRKY